MKQRFILYRRGEIYYCEDTTTRKQASLRTSDRAEAERLLHARNEAVTIRGLLWRPSTHGVV